MANKKIGKQTVKLSNPPTISSVYSIVGPKEGEGPLAKYFDMIIDDENWGEKTWEKAESKIVKECVSGCLGYRLYVFGRPFKSMCLFLFWY